MGGDPALEEGTAFTPRYGTDGLVAVVCTDAETGAVLMLAWANAEAVALTLETGYAHFWTRSRKRIWRKGEDSGNQLRVLEIRTDCDQDALWLKVAVEGNGVACHTGRESCFYRRVVGADGAPRLVRIDGT